MSLEPPAQLPVPLRDPDTVAAQLRDLPPEIERFALAILAARRFRVPDGAILRGACRLLVQAEIARALRWESGALPAPPELVCGEARCTGRCGAGPRLPSWRPTSALADVIFDAVTGDELVRAVLRQIDTVRDVIAHRAAAIDGDFGRDIRGRFTDVPIPAERHPDVVAQTVAAIDANDEALVLVCAALERHLEAAGWDPRVAWAKDG